MREKNSAIFFSPLIFYFNEFAWRQFLYLQSFTSFNECGGRTLGILSPEYCTRIPCRCQYLCWSQKYRACSSAFSDIVLCVVAGRRVQVCRPRQNTRTWISCFGGFMAIKPEQQQHENCHMHTLRVNFSDCTVHTLPMGLGHACTRCNVMQQQS